MIFVDGRKVVSKNILPIGDMAGAITEISSRINYDYAIGPSGPWWADGSASPAVSFKVGGASASLADLGSDMAAGFVGRMDEVRVWTVGLSEIQMQDTAFEVGWWEGCSILWKIASIDFVHIQGNLTLYLGNNNTRPGQADSDNFNEIGMGPRVVASATGMVQDAMMEGYIEKDPVVDLRNRGPSILMEMDTGEKLSVSVLMKQGGPLMMDLIIRDPNYDDVVEVAETAKFSPDYVVTATQYDCYRLNGLPLRLECSNTTTTGWSAFQGVDGYAGPVNSQNNEQYGRGLRNSITNEEFRTHPTFSCIGWGSKNPRFRREDTFPAPTTVQSQVAYRVVWDPDLSLEWWMPEDGLVVQIDINSYDRYRLNPSTGAPLRGMFAANATVHVRFSPEWITSETYPRNLVGEPEVDGASLLQPEAEGKAYRDQHFYVAVGNEVKVQLRARDRNLGETLQVMATEDPGLPPGHSPHSQSIMTFDDTVMTPAGNRSCFAPTSPLPPPNFFDRTLTFRPSEVDLGFSYRSCFTISTLNTDADPLMLDKTAIKSADVLCITIHVQAPTAAFDFVEDEYSAIIGCETVIPFSVNDTSADPYSLTITTVEDERNVCDSSGCRAIEGGLPAGLQISTAVAGTGAVTAELRWKPKRGQDLHEPYRVCLVAYAGVLEEGARMDSRFSSRHCINIKVRKCQYCMQPGESLDTVAHSFQMDYLQLYMLNPFFKRPDTIHPGTVISTGALYEVREGDYLHELAQRFLVAPDDLIAANPDLRMGGETLHPGMLMCVRTPLCDVSCKYDTDCHRTGVTA